MAAPLPDKELERLRAWLAVARRQPAAAGYQGQVHLYDGENVRLAVKEANGWGPLLWSRRWMLRREHAIYERLGDVDFAPRCYGLLDGRYLLLELVDGAPFRNAELADREEFFDRLLEGIGELHRRGIAHGDLKRKENLLVVDGRRPCLLDFGTAVIERQRGFHPWNAFLFDTLRQYDLNAWVKLKSDRRIDLLPAEERALYRRSSTERISRFFKQTWLRLRWGRQGPPPRRR